MSFNLLGILESLDPTTSLIGQQVYNLKKKHQQSSNPFKSKKMYGFLPPGYPAPQGYFPQHGYPAHYPQEMMRRAPQGPLPGFYPYQMPYPPQYYRPAPKQAKTPLPNPYKEESLKLTNENSVLLEKIKRHTIDVCNLKKRVNDSEAVSAYFKFAFNKLKFIGDSPDVEGNPMQKRQHRRS